MISLKTNLVYSMIFLSFSTHATVSFESVKTSGLGCPTNSTGTAIAFAPDNRSLSVLLDPMDAEIRKPQYIPGAPKTTQRDCLVEASYHANYDEQYVITTNDWRGNFSLPSSTSASVKAETWLSYLSPMGTPLQTPIVQQSKSFVGPIDPVDSSFVLSSSLPEAKTVTECGQSFNLNMKLTSSLTSTNKNEDSLIAINSLDVSQSLENPTVQKIACLNPWNAEVVGPIENETINVKISTEKSKLNQLASLYVVGLYQGQFYSWTPNDTVVWKNVDFNNINPDNSLKKFIAYVSGNAPATFNFSINNLSSTFHGATVYVGVGYGPTEEARYSDLMNTLRYKAVYVIP